MAKEEKTGLDALEELYDNPYDRWGTPNYNPFTFIDPDDKKGDGQKDGKSDKED